MATPVLEKKLRAVLKDTGAARKPLDTITHTDSTRMARLVITAERVKAQVEVERAKVAAPVAEEALEAQAKDFIADKDDQKTPQEMALDEAERQKLASEIWERARDMIWFTAFFWNLLGYDTIVVRNFKNRGRINSLFIYSLSLLMATVELTAMFALPLVFFIPGAWDRFLWMFGIRGQDTDDDFNKLSFLDKCGRIAKRSWLWVIMITAIVYALGQGITTIPGFTPLTSLLGITLGFCAISALVNFGLVRRGMGQTFSLSGLNEIFTLNDPAVVKPDAPVPPSKAGQIIGMVLSSAIVLTAAFCFGAAVKGFFAESLTGPLHFLAPIGGPMGWMFGGVTFFCGIGLFFADYASFSKNGWLNSLKEAYGWDKAKTAQKVLAVLATLLILGGLCFFAHALAGDAANAMLKNGSSHAVLFQWINTAVIFVSFLPLTLFNGVKFFSRDVFEFLGSLRNSYDSAAMKIHNGVSILLVLANGTANMMMVIAKTAIRALKGIAGLFELMFSCGLNIGGVPVRKRKDFAKRVADYVPRSPAGVAAADGVLPLAADAGGRRPGVGQGGGGGGLRLRAPRRLLDAAAADATDRVNPLVVAGVVPVEGGMPLPTQPQQR
ncbi:MAG TPA: hypothetical protein VJB02_00620 [Coxiellaceae bacterium]|nr:hypothetical protein [Coxiellaceae bacterium]